MRKLLLTGLAALLAGGGLYYGWRRTHAKAPTQTYRTATASRGDITQLVTASGTLSAITTVAVGSQVSGNITQLHADYNDAVAAGQLIAEIDDTSYQARLVQAEADYLAAKATLELKQLADRRTAALLAQKLVSQSDYDEVGAALRQQEAVTKKAEAAVNSARLDVEHCRITSPINGVVLSRSVDIGQTMQSSFSAPTLFTLAQDLRQMQITANISEADIGGVASGQAVTFTVDAFPGVKFRGTVREVRNNSTTSNNVVTYPTIVTVDNSDLKLRPGMTANVTITVASRTDVVRVPNAALRFRPPSSAAFRPPSNGARPNFAGPPSGGGHPPSGEPPKMLFIVTSTDAGTELSPTPVVIGLADATHTEIVSGLDADAVIATGTSSGTTPATANKSETNNPFGPPKPPSSGKNSPPPPPM